MTEQIKLKARMAKYNSVKLRKSGNSDSVTIPKNPYTKNVKKYTPYIADNGTVVLKPTVNHKHVNPWTLKSFRNYNFRRDMKSDPNLRPLDTKLGNKYEN